MPNTNFLSNTANFSCATKYVATQMTVGSAPTLLMSADAARNHILIQNQSAVDIYIAYQSTMVYGQGERVTQWGKWERAWAVNNEYLGAVYAVTSAGTATCVLHEATDEPGF